MVSNLGNRMEIIYLKRNRKSMLLGPVMIPSCGWGMTRLMLFGPVIILSHDNWCNLQGKNGMIKNQKFTYLEKLISCISYKYPCSQEMCHPWRSTVCDYYGNSQRWAPFMIVHSHGEAVEMHLVATKRDHGDRLTQWIFSGLGCRVTIYLKSNILQSDQHKNLVVLFNPWVNYSEL